MTEKPSTTLHGTVEEILTPSDPSQPEKAKITVQGVDGLRQEIHIENTLTSENGEQVMLNQGATVTITIKA